MPPEGTTAPDAAAQQRRVLVVDDEPGFRELLKRILEPAGYEVETAANAHSALERLAERPPAVAVCDIHMPGPDGLWLASQIRERSPATAVVLATSDDTIPPRETFRKGVVAYVVKPWRAEAVLKAVADGVKWFAAETHQAVAPLTPVERSIPARDPQPLTTAVPPVAAAHSEARRRSTRTWALAVALVVVAIAVFSYQYWHSRPNRMPALVAASAGAVIVEDVSGKTISQGSGFFVGPEAFVTNHHVVNGGYKARIVVGEHVYTVTGLVAASREHDLVLLTVAEPSPSVLALNLDMPAAGDEILVYGAPLGLEGTLSTGIISAIRTKPRNELQISAPISHGSSGSPVVNAQGEVVGVVASSYLAEGQNLNFAIPAMYVRDLLNTAGAGRPLIAATRGAGDDLERHELIGPVRMVTVFAPEPGVAGVPRTLLDSKTIFIFDRNGRLVEKTLGDDKTRTQYTYNEQGRPATIADRDGETIINTWNFVAAGPGAIEASIGAAPSGSTHRFEYGDDGRLLKDELRAGDRVLSSTRWSYDGPGWPSAITTGSQTQVTTVAAAAPPGAREEHDALGNPIRRTVADGTDVRFEYQFDSRGNWVSRTAIPVTNPAGQEPRVERRKIEYW